MELYFKGIEPDGKIEFVLVGDNFLCVLPRGTSMPLEECHPDFLAACRTSLAQWQPEQINPLVAALLAEKREARKLDWPAPANLVSRLQESLARAEGQRRLKDSERASASVREFREQMGNQPVGDVGRERINQLARFCLSPEEDLSGISLGQIARESPKRFEELFNNTNTLGRVMGVVEPLISLLPDGVTLTACGIHQLSLDESELTYLLMRLYVRAGDLSKLDRHVTLGELARQASIVEDPSWLMNDGNLTIVRGEAADACLANRADWRVTFAAHGRRIEVRSAPAYFHITGNDHAELMLRLKRQANSTLVSWHHAIGAALRDQYSVASSLSRNPTLDTCEHTAHVALTSIEQLIVTRLEQAKMLQSTFEAIVSARHALAKLGIPAALLAAHKAAHEPPPPTGAST